LPNSIRDDIDRAIARGDAAAAAAGLGQVFREAPTAASAAFVNSRFDQIKASLPLTPFRLAILRSFTIEPLVPLLQARCALAGIDLTVHVGDFNVFERDLYDGHAPLYGFQPSMVALAALTMDVAPGLWHGDRLAEDSEHTAGRVAEWLRTFRRHSSAPLLVQSFEEPAFPSRGVMDAQQPSGQREAVRRLNCGVLVAAREHRNVYVLDYDGLVARHGRSAWRDAHKHLAMRMPLRPEAFGWLAEEYMRFIHPVAGKICKAVAVDLDDTLWGGIVGEVGVDGVQIGTDYPGAAYLQVQRVLKNLAARGILLAVCSKNNPADAHKVFRDRAEMLLHADDFAAMRVNWDDKAANLRSIASELNIGVDAIAFVDDNPVEREWIRAELPEVTVIDLPGDPVGFADALVRSPVFERLDVSEQDRARSEQYQAQRARRAAEQHASSIDDFLTSLAMSATFGDATGPSLARIAQLTQRTNQFNLTTKRYTDEEVARLAADPATFVRAIRVTDRFGDNGLVGVAIARVAAERCEIDSFLLSCRVIGRRIETALLAHVAREARKRGARVLAGWYRPTPKNAPARDFYATHRFERACDDELGSLWELDLTRHEIETPSCITCS
jgi:FkbH-like protein